MGSAAMGMTKIETSVHLMRLFSGDAPIIADYRWLEKKPRRVGTHGSGCPHQSRVSKLNFLERMKLVEDNSENGSRVSAK